VRKVRRRSEELDLGKYDTDKIPNNYLHVYDCVFESLIERPVKLLSWACGLGDPCACGEITFLTGPLPVSTWSHRRASRTMIA
jgi:hypothetical protein